MMAARRSTPGLFELLQEADLSQFYNDLRSNLRICHVQQLKCEYIFNPIIHGHGPFYMLVLLRFQPFPWPTQLQKH